MNRLFRWGILIALVILAISSFIALRIVFGDNAGTVVPSLVGLQSEEAVQRLSDIGLDAEVADQPDSNYPEGTVFWQSISPGKKAVLGMVVTLRVSRGLPRAPIPDVRGKEFAAAVQELDSKGFKLGAVIRVADRLKQPGTVIAQNPAAPAMAPGSRMVDLLVSEGGPERAETVQVPDVRGQTEGQARQIIEQSDLTVSRVITVESSQAPGTVIRTEPRNGARLPSGRAVTLHVARAPEPAAETQTTLQTQPAQTRPAVDAPPSMTGASSGAGQAPEMSTWNPNQASPAQTRPQVPAVPQGQSQPTAPSRQQPPVQINTSVAPLQGKVARIRYQVPPLARPLGLRILMNDQTGTKALREQQVQGGEYISMDAPYTGNASVTVILGDQQVWQERYN